MRVLYRCAALAASVCLVLSISSYASAEPASKDIGAYHFIAQNETLALYFDNARAAVGIQDKRTGYFWCSALPAEEYPSGVSMTDLLKSELSSLITLEYAEMNKTTSVSKTEPLMNLSPKVTAETIPDGVRVVFYIEKLNLRFAVELVLDKDSLLVRVPQERMEEGVGVKETIQKKLVPVTSFLTTLADIADSAASDTKIPSRYRSGMRAVGEDVAALRGSLKSTASAVGIETVTDGLLTSLDAIEKKYAGSTSAAGILSSLTLDGSVPEDIRSEYAGALSRLSAGMLGARIALSSLKTVVVGGIVSISLLPYFGAAGDQDDGYMFYPDGCGAIVRYKQAHGSFSYYYKSDVYSEDTPNIDLNNGMTKAGLTGTMLPAFGVKNGESAFIAYAGQGGSNSYVSMMPSGYILNVNRSFLSFRFRRAIASSSGTVSFVSGAQESAYETEREQYTPAVRYMFLANENADYSGMAVRLRQELSEKGILKKSSVLNGNMPVAVTVWAGARKQGMLTDAFVGLTDYDEAARMVEELSAVEKTTLLLNLVGWSSTGANRFPQSVDAASQLGGPTALRRLAQTAAADGARLYLQCNVLYSQISSKSHSNTDAALANNLMLIKSKDGLQTLISPRKTAEEAAQSLALFKKWGISGVCYDQLGQFLYYDYSEKNRATRPQVEALWQKLLTKTRDTLGSAAVTGGNAYTLGSADWLVNIPESSTGYSFEDAEIPFYQMLVHGYIPYSSKPFNQFYDSASETLHAIEYGGIPYFSLAAWEDLSLTEELSDVYYSTEASRKGEVLSAFQKFSSDFGALADVPIVRHETIGSSAAVVTFENGTSVLINYADSEQTIRGVRVGALSYAITGEKRSVGLVQRTPAAQDKGESRGIPVPLAVALGICGLLLISACIFAGAFVQRRRRH